jgi:hypothetical protein
MGETQMAPDELLSIIFALSSVVVVSAANVVVVLIN